MRGTLAVVVAALALTSFSQRAPAAGEATPRDVVARSLNQVLEVVHDTSLPRAERRRRLEAIARARFDTNATSRLVLARSWKRFSPPQREEFRREFEEYLLRTYGDRIDRYTEGSMEVETDRQEPRGDVTVRTRVVGGPFDGAIVDYRLRQREEDWRIIDVIVEGISLVANYRDQFKQVLARGGPEHLLEALREKNDDVNAETEATEAGVDPSTPAP